MKTILNLSILILILISCGEKKLSDKFEPIVKLDSTKTDKIDSIFSKYNQSTPGYAVAIVQNEEVVFMKTYGMANPKKKISIIPDSAFPIASNSKQFTCMSILLLMEQGKLHIDDSVTKYVPEIPNYEKQVTIKHLMQHTSGIIEFNPLLFLSDINKNECTITNGEIVSLISKYPYASYNAGEKFFYTNSAYVLLAKVIENVSKQTYADFIKENIFNPLKMDDSKVITLSNDYSNMVMGFENRGNYKPTNCRMITTGASGIVTTLNDLIKWTNNYHHNQLGKKDQNLIANMQTKGVLNNGDSIKYGLGLFIENTCKQKTIWHGGMISGYTSNITLLPEKETSIIVLSNTMDRIPYKHRYDIKKILFNDCADFVSEPFPGSNLGIEIVENHQQNETDLSDYIGIFSIHGFPKKFDISVKDGQLVANIADKTFKLKKYSTDIFISEPIIFKFIRDNKNQISGLILHGEKFRNLKLKRTN